MYPLFEPADADPVTPWNCPARRTQTSDCAIDTRDAVRPQAELSRDCGLSLLRAKSKVEKLIRIAVYRHLREPLWPRRNSNAFPANAFSKRFHGHEQSSP